MSTERLDRLMNPAEVAEYLHVPLATIYGWRVRGEGPRASKIGRHLRYAEAEVARWVASRTDQRDAG